MVDRYGYEFILEKHLAQLFNEGQVADWMSLQDEVYSFEKDLIWGTSIESGKSV